jgi:phosphate transport system substrate-binding protein
MRIKSILMTAVIMVFFAASGSAANIDVNGSTTVLPIMQKAVEAYMSKHPEIEFTVSGTGSGNGIKAMIDGTTDIAMASRFIKDKEVKAAFEKGVYPVPFVVGIDALVPVVHPSNPVENLSLDQMKKIYMGEIKNWEDVGGPDKRIVVISRDTSSGTYETWSKIVLNKERVFPGALLQASNGAVVQAVSKNPNAIGYIGYGYLNGDVKQIAADGVMGGPDTLAKYPISRDLYVFTDGWPKGETKGFIMWLQNPHKGQKYVDEAGYMRLW